MMIFERITSVFTSQTTSNFSKQPSTKTASSTTILKESPPVQMPNNTTINTATARKQQQTCNINIKKCKPIRNTNSNNLPEAEKKTLQSPSNQNVLKLHKAMVTLFDIWIEMEKGISRTQKIWENLVNLEDELQDIGHWEMQREVAPKQQSLMCDILVKLIAIENSMLNRLEDLQNFIDKQFTFDVSRSSNSNPHVKIKAEEKLDHHRLIELFKYDSVIQAFPHALQLHEFLQVNEHIDRVMLAFQYIDHIKKLYHVCQSADQQEFTEDLPLEQIHKKFQMLLQNYETTVLKLNYCLKLN